MNEVENEVNKEVKIKANKENILLTITLMTFSIVAVGYYIMIQSVDNCFIDKIHSIEGLHEDRSDAKTKEIANAFHKALLKETKQIEELILKPDLEVFKTCYLS
ncbi:hypothetical protein [Psychromonas aquatilis]|uniref:Uncharacterized protein n=1 Tax=Psychromonas aquatilis TaxID=2005072 RepID=A0ABU9GRH9_9GAMM